MYKLLEYNRFWNEFKEGDAPRIDHTGTPTGFDSINSGNQIGIGF